MSVAQDLLVLGEGGLIQGDGPVQIARRLVGVGEVVAAGQGAGVGVAQDLFALGEGGLVQGNGPVRAVVLRSLLASEMKRR